ncbi:unnamed protein product, partial [Staurois parvus]
MYVKCFETKMTVSKIKKICRRLWPPYVPCVLTLAGTGTRKLDAASAGGDGRGRCRGH